MEIFAAYIIAWSYQDSWPPPPWPQKVTANLKPCKNKTKNKIKYFQLL